MKKLFGGLLLTVLCGFFFFFPSSARAESIRDFTTDIVVNTDGSIRVKERISYDFGSLEKHGIYRTIPFIKVNEDGKRYKMELGSVSITDGDGVRYSYSTTYSNNTIQYKIGDRDRLITGEHVYVIDYEVKGALTYYSDHDELYWNITGNEWTVPIEMASFTATLPSTITSSDIRTGCFTGAYKSTEKSCSLTTQSSTVSGRTTRTLGLNEGLSAVVGFPKGTVAVVEPKLDVPFESTLLGKVVFFILGLLAFVWYVGLPVAIPVIWFLFGRDPKTSLGEVRAWFDPPVAKDGRKLTPSETGVLVDESVDTRDIFAGIIDLARRGHLKIVEKKPKDFYFVQQSGANDSTLMQPFETELLRGIFGNSDGEKEVRLKDKKMASSAEKVKDMLYVSMTKGGFFPHNPASVRTVWYVIAGIAFFTGNIFLAVVAFIFGRVMPKKTVYGAGQANVGKSLKNFLSSQQRELEFQARNQMFFEKLLPFAIAFGVEKIWAERFKDIDLKSPDWYEGYHTNAFTTAYFLNSMHSSYSSFSVAATPVRSTTGHSSGFGGGGFSGGGGGGGGGGSW